MIRVEREQAVAVVVMDRPKVNALSPAFLEALDQGLAEAWDAPGTRAVVLASAQERAFSAGFDLKELDRLEPAEFAGFFGAFARLYRRHHRGGLHPAHLPDLIRHAEVLVDEAQAPGPGHGDGQGGLGDRVHGGAHQGDAQVEVPGQPRPRPHLGRQHLREGRLQRHVINGEGVTDGLHGRLLAGEGGRG